jgi:hypothetical protein
MMFWIPNDINCFVWISNYHNACCSERFNVFLYGSFLLYNSRILND